MKTQHNKNSSKISKQATKTKNQTETTKNKLHIVVIIGAILIFIAPLLHIDLPTKNKEVEVFKETYNSQFDEIKEQKVLIRKQYDSKKINGDQKIRKDDLLEKEEKELLIVYKVGLKEVVDKNRVFGWKTLKKFLIGFGVRIPYLFFTFIFIYLIKIINTQDKHLKRAFIFAQIALFTISFYLIIWSFWDKQDFPKGYYYTTALFLGFISSIATVSFLKYRTFIELKLKTIISTLIDFIVHSEKYMEDKKTKVAYFKDYMKKFDEITK